MQAALPHLQRIIDLAFNQGDLSIVDELMAAEAVTHLERWGMPANRTGLKLFITAFRTAFPDLLCQIEGEIYQGDRLAVRWILRGTHHGPFMGNPPSGKPVEVLGTIFARTLNGLIVEMWILMDQFELLQQLGIVPPP